MILFWYTHWFWITVLVACTSAVQTLLSEADSPALTSHSTRNASSHTSAENPGRGEGARQENATQTLLESTTTHYFNITTHLSNITMLATTATADNVTPSVIEANSTLGLSEDEVTSTSDAFEIIGAAFNDSTLDRAAAVADGSEAHPLSAAGITGITLGCVCIVAVVCGVSYVWYRGRGFNRPQVLTDRSSNLDSSGYIDDTSVRDNSEEMYSLDNDSFLNSLEAMTIQNYWTDTVKHTKL